MNELNSVIVSELINKLKNLVEKIQVNILKNFVCTQSDDSDIPNAIESMLFQDYEEILLLLQHDSTTSKRDGLVSFQSFLHGMNSMMWVDLRPVRLLEKRLWHRFSSEFSFCF